MVQYPHWIAHWFNSCPWRLTKFSVFVCADTSNTHLVHGREKTYEVIRVLSGSIIPVLTKTLLVWQVIRVTSPVFEPLENCDSSWKFRMQCDSSNTWYVTKKAIRMHPMSKSRVSSLMRFGENAVYIYFSAGYLEVDMLKSQVLWKRVWQVCNSHGWAYIVKYHGVFCHYGKFSIGISYE